MPIFMHTNTLAAFFRDLKSNPRASLFSRNWQFYVEMLVQEVRVLALRNKLKYWRHQKMMNQKEFAAFLEINQSQISRWELQKEQPSLESAFRISKKLQVLIEDLFEHGPE